MNLVAIGDLVEAVEKRDPRANVHAHTFTYVDIGAVSQTTKSIEEPQDVLCAEAPSRARQVIECNDVLVSTVRPNLNAVAKVPEGLSGAIASTGFSVLRANPRKLHASYLYHWVRTEAFINTMMMQATGQSYPAVSDKIVKTSQIPLPPLDEQRRIAGILDQADALRRLRARSLEKLSVLADAILLASLKDSRAESERKSFSDLAEKNRNSFCNGPFGSDLLTTELTDTGVPVVYIKDIASGRYVRKSKAHVTERKAQQLSACVVKAGDLLIAKVGTPPCSAAVYPDGAPPAIVTQDVIRVRIDSSIATPEFIAAFLNSQVGRETVHPIVVQATRARVSLKDLKGLHLTLPKLATQRLVSKQLNCLTSTRSLMVQDMNRLETLFTSLQHRAFRGDL